MGRISITIPVFPAALLLIPSAAGIARGKGQRSTPIWSFGAGASCAARGQSLSSADGPWPYPWYLRSTGCLGFRVQMTSRGLGHALSGRLWRHLSDPCLMG